MWASGGWCQPPIVLGLDYFIYIISILGIKKKVSKKCRLAEVAQELVPTNCFEARLTQQNPLQYLGQCSADHCFTLDNKKLFGGITCI